jgi:predicted SAM-dependent methyltransferase
MLPRALKATYFALAGPAMVASGAVYRRLLAPRSGVVRVHLGPGQANYLPGWINVDANLITGKVDVWSDLRRALPFRDATVDQFYSHHVIEHLPDSVLPFHFAEMARCLKPGGAIRIGGPNGDEAIKKFVEGDAGWFVDWPDKRRSIGGRFANFILCRGEHLTILTESYVRELLEDAAFVDITRRAPGLDTGYPDIVDSRVLALEQESTPEAPHTLLLEARKPG